MRLVEGFKKVWANRSVVVGNERGEVRWGGGGKQKQTSTTTSQVAPLTPQQQALYTQNLQLAQLQGQGLQDAMGRQQTWEASPLWSQQQLLQKMAQDQMQARLGGQANTPQEAAMLEAYYAPQRARGLEDLRNEADRAAAMRGMTRADSPIGNGYLQSVQRFGSDLAGAQAGSGLQLGQANQQFWQGLMDRGNSLQQQAQQNRLALSTAQPPGFGLQNYIDNFRAASAPKTTTTTGSGGTSPQFGLGLGSIGQGIGGIGQGVSAYDRYKNPQKYASPAPIYNFGNQGATQPVSYNAPASNLWL
jgi:hypothetical protein